MLDAIHDIHNRLAGKIVAEIVKPTLEAGGDTADVLVLLESVVTGVLGVMIKLGGDDRVIDAFHEGVRQRLAEIRLNDIPIAGNS